MTLTPFEKAMIDKGLARMYAGRLIPVIRGGDPLTDPLFPDVPADFATLDAEALGGFIAATEDRIDEIAADHAAFVTDTRDAPALVTEMTAAVAALKQARAALAAIPEAPEAVAPVDPPAETDDDFAAQLEALAAEAEEPEPETPEPPAAVEEPPAEIVAAAPPIPAAVPRRAPARSARSTPTPTRQPSAALIAAATMAGVDTGDEISPEQLGAMMIKRREQFGRIPDGTRGERIPLARMDWRDFYPAERTLTGDDARDDALVASAVNQSVIQAEMQRRRGLGEAEALTASGGLCAPVTPYYQLQQLSIAVRPVRDSLPAFNADRGGLKYARPPGLSAITTGVGVITAAQDAAGGSSATKTCQTFACPAFTETDVAAIFHCGVFGNFGMRTFPERVAFYNELVLSAHARVSDGRLLTQIDAASTQITAANLGLGASATLPSQYLQAAASIRSRNRMGRDAVVRIILPAWVLDLFVSDVYRSQFQRFEMTQAQFVALLRSNNIEPTFTLDGASGKGQVFGTQAAGTLLSFPPTIHSLIFPEGSHLYLDGGTLELGLIRDSVLNSTNDAQIFGETFEEVAFIGVESFSLVTTVCDSGAVSLPVKVVSCENSHNS